MGNSLCPTKLLDRNIKFANSNKHDISFTKSNDYKTPLIQYNEIPMKNLNKYETILKHHNERTLKHFNNDEIKLYENNKIKNKKENVI